MSEKKLENAVTVNELAAMLRISPQAVFKRIRRGTLKPSGERNGVMVFDRRLAARLAAQGQLPKGRPKGSQNAKNVEYPSCPVCEHKMRRHGFVTGRQRYRCPACGKSFIDEESSLDIPPTM